MSLQNFFRSMRRGSVFRPLIQLRESARSSRAPQDGVHGTVPDRQLPVAPPLKCAMVRSSLWKAVPARTSASRNRPHAFAGGGRKCSECGNENIAGRICLLATRMPHVAAPVNRGVHAECTEYRDMPSRPTVWSAHDLSFSCASVISLATIRECVGVWV
jgi:hypothetical protein